MRLAAFNQKAPTYQASPGRARRTSTHGGQPACPVAAKKYSARASGTASKQDISKPGCRNLAALFAADAERKKDGSQLQHSMQVAGAGLDDEFDLKKLQARGQAGSCSLVGGKGCSARLQRSSLGVW